ncbi:hypothetical protein ACHAQJ_008807 [Trichoderma viride]
MLHHLSLPSRRTPLPPGNIFSDNTSFGYNHSGPFGLSPSKILSQPRSCSHDVAKSAETDPDYDDDDVQSRKGSNSKLISVDPEEENEQHLNFDPANSGTWGWKDLKSLPIPRNNGDRDDDAQDSSLLSSLTTTSPQIISQNSDHFLKMMDDLSLDASDPTSSTKENISRHLRKTSSSYPSQGNASTRVQSPESLVHPNKLSLTNLSRFSKANDRLSNLRSTLSDEGYDMSMSTAPPEAMEEAITAIAQWQGELRPRVASYNKYQLSESAELLPSDSASQQQSHSGAHLPLPTPRSAKGRGGLTWRSVEHIKGQLDGTHETMNRFESPDPAIRLPCAPINQERPHKQSKRKASVFSLRSLTNSLSKRPRFGLRKWANTVYQQGSRRLNMARLKWRHQPRQDRRVFEAWRARHRRMTHDGTPRKEKSEKNYGTFPSERKVCTNEDWWRDGVSRYEAPKWMNFRSSVPHSHG